MDNITHGLRFYLLPTTIRSSGERYAEILKSAYMFWKEMNTKAIDAPLVNQFYSDHFLITDEVGILVKNHEVIGTIFISFLDFNNQFDLDRHCFACYPETVRRSLNNRYKKIIMISNLCIREDFKKKNFPQLSCPLALVGLAVKRFQHSKDEALISINQKGNITHNSLYNFGGQKFRTDSIYEIDFDITGIEKNQVGYFVEDKTKIQIDKLWSQKISTLFFGLEHTDHLLTSRLQIEKNCQPKVQVTTM